MKPMLSFCLHSLLREYGWQFVWRVALPHPLRTVGAVFGSLRLDLSGEMVSVVSGRPEESPGGPGSVVGVGFCLKPIDPRCPSGRFNHDCYYLEHLPDSRTKKTPECCRRCEIRRVGLMTLKTGSAFYIMTSAKEILLDLFVPALRARCFTSGLFVMCRYSLQPFAVGLLASGIKGRMLSFDRGDCRDYRTWLKADVGEQNEWTSVSPSSGDRISQILRRAERMVRPALRFGRRGNILYPE